MQKYCQCRLKVDCYVSRKFKPFFSCVVNLFPRLRHLVLETICQLIILVNFLVLPIEVVIEHK